MLDDRDKWKNKFNELNQKLNTNDREKIEISRSDFNKLQKIEFGKLYLNHQKSEIYGWVDGYNDEFKGIITYSEYKKFLYKKYIIPYNNSLSFKNYKNAIIKEKNLYDYINGVIVNDRIDFVVKK